MNTDRTTFVSISGDGKVRRTRLSSILRNLGENPAAPEYQNTPAIQQAAQALVQAKLAVGIVILFDGNAILSAGDTSTIEPSEYN